MYHLNAVLYFTRIVSKNVKMCVCVYVYKYLLRHKI